MIRAIRAKATLAKLYRHSVPDVKILCRTATSLYPERTERIFVVLDKRKPPPVVAEGITVKLQEVWYETCVFHYAANYYRRGALHRQPGGLISITARRQLVLLVRINLYRTGRLLKPAGRPRLRAAMLILEANNTIGTSQPGNATHHSSQILPDAPCEGVIVNLAELRLYYYYPPGENLGVQCIPSASVCRTGNPRHAYPDRAKIPNPDVRFNAHTPTFA